MRHTPIALLVAFLAMPASHGVGENDGVSPLLLGAKTWQAGQVFQGEPVPHDFVIQVPKGHTVRIKSVRPT